MRICLSRCAVKICGGLAIALLPGLSSFAVDGGLALVKDADASYEQKADAFKELARDGSAAAVPELAAFLGDEQWSHLARYALEPIPDPSVDAAFRAALETLEGKLLAGVIGSIGARRDAGSVGPLIALLDHQDPGVASAAAVALGRIGTLAAGSALRDALDGTEGALRLAVGDGLLRSSARLVEGPHREDALRFYEALSAPGMPRPLRQAATHAVILHGGDHGLRILSEKLGSEDFHEFTIGLGAAHVLPDKAVAPVLIGMLDTLPQDRMMALIEVLGRSGGDAAVPVLLERAKAGAKPVRLAAITAAGETGKTSVTSTMMDLLLEPDGDIARAAGAILAGLPGEEVDDAILAGLDRGDPALRLKMIDLAGQRRIDRAMPILLRGLSDPDAAVRAASVRSCGEMAGMAEFPTLLAALAGNRDPGDVGALERVVGLLVSLSDDKETCGARIVEALAGASPAAKPSLLRLLGVTEEAAGLAAVVEAAHGEDRELRLCAIRVLSAWRTADAAPALLTLAKASADDHERLLSLRGYLGMATRQEMPLDDRIGLCKQAHPLIQRDDERKMLLGVAHAIGSPALLPEVLAWMDHEAIREEAIATIFAVVEKTGQAAHTEETAAALTRVMAVGTAGQREQAGSMLQQMEARN